MAITSGYAPTRSEAPVHRAYQVLHIGFIVAPIVAGADKFFNVLVEWSQYLSPMVTRYVAAETFMMVVGAIEVAAGIIVAFRPRFGGYLVAFWLWAIIANLLTIPGFYDIALRDFGLSLGALALAQLATHFDQSANSKT